MRGPVGYSSDNMKRPLPSITTGQAKSIADYSKQKTLSEASVNRSEEIRHEAEKSHEMLERSVKSQGKFAKWFPRVVIFPIAYMAIWGCFITIRSIWTGVIPTISRNSAVPPVFQISEPIYFWISVAVYSAMSVLFTFMSIRLIGMTGWFGASNT